MTVVQEVFEPELKPMPESKLKNEEVKDILELNKLPRDTVIRYLNTYVGVTDWLHYLGEFQKKQSKHTSDQIRQFICCAILLPAIDRSTYIDPAHPENLLMKVPYYHQIGERDWFALFQEVFALDVDIDTRRVQMLGLGIIRPIRYAIYSHQAFNWLYEHADATGVIQPTTKEDISARFTTLVEAYGGCVVCNAFTRHAEAVTNLVNWRTGYFFERALHKIYTFDQMAKIKKQELKETNKNLVKSVRLI